MLRSFRPTCNEIDPKIPSALISLKQFGAIFPLQTKPVADLAAKAPVLTPAALSSGSRLTMVVRTTLPMFFETSSDFGRAFTAGFVKAKCMAAPSAAPQPKFSALKVGLEGGWLHDSRSR